jgi:hypothetical protein
MFLRNKAKKLLCFNKINFQEVLKPLSRWAENLASELREGRKPRECPQGG